ncbi:MAG TPA: hypothetical protein VFN96_05485 [Gemmatimonadales bacterium]|nr:hypothetical protein [Gemmatimonadales bacterium]
MAPLDGNLVPGPIAALLLCAAACGGTGDARTAPGTTSPFAGQSTIAAGESRPGRPAEGGPTDTVRRPRFKVELSAIRAVDETGFDWFGSDQIFALMDSPESRAITDVFGDVDSGEELQVPVQQSCVWPAIDPDGAKNRQWSCAADGAVAPVRFAISLYQRQQRTYYTASTDVCIELASPGVNDVYAVGAELCDARTGRRLLGMTYSYDEAQLLQKLPAPLAHMDIEDGFVQHGLSGYEYHFKVRITRMADSVEQRPREVER